MNTVRETLLELCEYVVPQDRMAAKLNQNESPYDIPLRFKQKTFALLKQIEWNRYPLKDASSLIDAVSSYTDFQRSGIVVGNGSNEIIEAVFQTFCSATEKVVLITPGFSIFSRIASIIGLEVCEVPLTSDFAFDVDAIIKNATGAKMIILASPNNPTGSALAVNQVRMILKSVNCMLVLDEAYFEFYGKTAQHLIEEFENLVIIRTLSKAFGLAGIRLGYLLAREEITKLIRKVKLPFSVGMFQQVVGEFLLKTPDILKNHIGKILKQRNAVYSEMLHIQGIKVFPSETNFILFKVENRTGKEVSDELYKNGVLVRHFEEETLNNMLRVTIGKPVENKLFLKKLKEVLRMRGK